MNYPALISRYKRYFQPFIMTKYPAKNEESKSAHIPHANPV